MVSFESVRKELETILAKHKTNGSLETQTPRMLREQLAVSLNESIGVIVGFKEEMKSWIRSFLDEAASSSESSSNSSGSDEVSSEENPHVFTKNASSAAGLRSIAKMIGVPPSFWPGLNKDNADTVKSKLSEFCQSKAIELKGDVPTMEEAKQYKDKREAIAELEGIDSSNIIVGSKRRRCNEFLF